MPRRVTLVALWAVFAVASVSVGFAAASMVSDPFTDVGTTTDVANLAGPGDAPVAVPAGQPAGTTAPSTRTPTARTTAPTRTPASSRGTPSTGSTKAPGVATSASIVTGGIPTPGGYVSGTCRDGLVSVGAAPAVYWRVVSRTTGRVHTAGVRLEPATNANGERVQVTVSCRNGTPVFVATYTEAGGGGGGGGGDGSDDGGGPIPSGSPEGGDSSGSGGG